MLTGGQSMKLDGVGPVDNRPFTDNTLSKQDICISLNEPYTILVGVRDK